MVIFPSTLSIAVAVGNVNAVPLVIVLEFPPVIVSTGFAVSKVGFGSTTFTVKVITLLSFPALSVAL